MKETNINDLLNIIESYFVAESSENDKLENVESKEVDSKVELIRKQLKTISKTKLKYEEIINENSDYKYALDQSAIVAVTNLKGDIEYVNDTFCRISKFSREELIGQNQRIVSSGYHSRDFWKEMWSVIGHGRVWRNEIRNKAKDGSIYWVDTTIVPFTEESGRPKKYLAIRFDITNKKLKEMELEEALKEVSNYKYALDQSAIVAITDLKGDIEYVNDTFCKISKYERGELIGQNQRIVNSEYHSRDFWKQMWSTIGHGKVWRNEIRNKAKDGSIYWVDTTIVPFNDDKGRPKKYIAIRFDITNKKHKEMELEEALKEVSNYKYALDQSAIVAITDRKGDIEYVNDTFCKISKYNRKE
ncbi:MAG: PAS domain-containing protein, partial [Cyclobacteriaceae bacterium]|nr:PAS domain-containing protein [Cyclobacteriaceae bacterium]